MWTRPVTDPYYTSCLPMEWSTSLDVGGNESVSSLSSDAIVMKKCLMTRPQ